MSRLELLVYGGIGLLALVPIVWAIVNVLRRPTWQFSVPSKVLWGLTLGVGWLVLWPLALMLSLFYLFSVRRRLRGGAPTGGPPGSAAPGGPGVSMPGAAPGLPPGSVPGVYQPPPGTWPQAPAPVPPPVPAPTPRDLPPANWYPDPAEGTGQRWWDGRGWSDHTR